MDEKQFYHEKLKEHLETTAGWKPSEVSSLLKQFSNSNGTGEQIFEYLENQYGMKLSRADIKSELERLNSQHGGINSDPKSRTKTYIDRYNAKLKKVEIEISDIETKNLLPHQLESIELARAERKNISLKMPEYARKNRLYVATAKHGNKNIKMELNVS